MIPQKTYFEKVTPKELETLRLISQGLTRKEVAKEQCRSFDTVKTHLCHAMQKLQARNVAHLVAIAKDLGLIGLLLGVCLQTVAPFLIEDDFHNDFRRGSAVRSYRVSRRDGENRISEDLF